jgi:hypothetical protein
MLLLKMLNLLLNLLLPKEGFTMYEPPKIIKSTPMVLEPVKYVVALEASLFS